MQDGRRDPRLLCRGKLSNPKLLATPFRMPKIILRLLIEPAFSGRSKRNGKTNGHLGTDTGPAVQNGGERLAANAKGLRGLRDAHAQGFKAKGFDDLARMRGVMHTHCDALFSDNPRNRRN